jgi:hypothetical protein
MTGNDTEPINRIKTMDTMQDITGYRTWGADNAAYGPVELPILVDWIRDERVTASTWIYLENKCVWAKAGEVPELNMFFSSTGSYLAGTGEKASRVTSADSGIPPEALRRIKLLAVMSDDELATLTQFLEVLDYRMFAQVVKAGEHSDAMYMILSGELRARTMVDGKETTLATCGVGDYFGEISLLDEGPRSADVIANTDAVVLRLSAGAFSQLRHEAPQLAADFLYALGRSHAGKIRALTKQYKDSIHFTRYATWH